MLFSQPPLHVFSQQPLQVDEQVLEQELPQPLHDESQEPVQLLSHAPQHPLHVCSTLLAERFKGSTLPNASIPIIGSDLDKAFLKNWRLVCKSNFCPILRLIFRNQTFYYYPHILLYKCRHILPDMCDRILPRMMCHNLRNSYHCIRCGMSSLRSPY